MSEPFIAEIRIFAGNFAPRGWAFCSGQFLPISQNTALFSILGTIYGGDGETDFALPDLRSRAAMHPGNGPGLTPRTLGERGGANQVTLTEANLPPHRHTHAATAFPANTFTPGPTAVSSRAVGGRPYSTAATDVNLSGDVVENTGGGQAHNNLQPYLGINYIIALIGIFPSRS